jgi:hypothetical protein
MIDLPQRIPNRLPMLDALVAERADDAPLCGVTAVIIQHQLGSIVPMVQALFALGESIIAIRVGAEFQLVTGALETVPAVALCGGAALYLLAHIGFLYRTTGRVFRRRTIGAVATNDCLHVHETAEE